MIKIFNYLILAGLLGLFPSAILAYEAEGHLLHQKSEATLSLDKPDSEDGTLYVEAISEEFDVNILGWSKLKAGDYEFELELDGGEHRFFRGDNVLYLEIEGDEAKKFASFIQENEETYPGDDR